MALAIAGGRPVVALESTLIAHGLPWPDNLETARDSERAVRDAGAIPATIAVLAGRLHIGLSDDQLERLARDSRDGSIWKAGRRDLSTAVASGRDAATTVSATAWAARASGIGVMATGGLGGVHRDASRTFDVSADLDELARADGLLLVCSGVKTILDVPATLEKLETLGVPVVGYRTSDFPAFTCVTSGLPLDSRVDDPAGAARLVRAHRAMGLPCAVLLAQPVDASHALDPSLFHPALSDALHQAQLQGITGKPLTPFLLDHIRQATSGQSLLANRSLIVSNARLAGRIAVDLSGP